MDIQREDTEVLLEDTNKIVLPTAEELAEESILVKDLSLLSQIKWVNLEEEDLEEEDDSLNKSVPPEFI